MCLLLGVVRVFVLVPSALIRTFTPGNSWNAFNDDCMVGHTFRPLTRESSSILFRKGDKRRKDGGNKQTNKTLGFEEQTRLAAP